MTPPPGAELRSLRTTWAAFLLACLLYVLAGLLATRSLALEIPAELLHWLVILVSLLSLLQLLTVLLQRQLIAGVSGGSYRRYCLLRWLLCETIALYGLALWVMGAAAWVFAGHGILAVALLAGQRPGAGDRERFAGILG